MKIVTVLLAAAWLLAAVYFWGAVGHDPSVTYIEEYAAGFSAAVGVTLLILGLALPSHANLVAPVAITNQKISNPELLICPVCGKQSPLLAKFCWSCRAIFTDHDRHMQRITK